VFKEIKHVDWDCDSIKSLVLNEINIGFIKDFWEELKEDLLCFLTELHCNGKLIRGINSTFIALIPKVESPQLSADFRLI